MNHSGIPRFVKQADPGRVGPIPKSANKHNAAIDRLRLMISTRGVGARIPGERDLGLQWGVARMTARKAVEALVAEGLLERRHGAGSFVAEVPYARMRGLSSFSADMRQRGAEPSTEVLSFETVLADGLIAGRLGVAEGEELFRFSRCRLADGEYVGLETTWIASSLVPELVATDLDGSLFETLATKFGIHPGQATSVIDAVAAGADTAKILGLGESQPCLRVEMDYLDTRRRPLMAATCLYRPDRYQLHAVLTQSAMTRERPGS